MNIDISIIVPTHDRKELLKECLFSLFAQDYPKEKYEIIVIDDRSDIEIKRMSDELKALYGNLRYFPQYRKGPASARNLGAVVAKGEIVGFVDDDCILTQGWIRLMTEEHRRNSHIAAVGGFTLTPSDKTPLLVSQFLSTGAIETQFNGKREVIFFPTCNVTFKRWVFNEYKFDEKFPFPGGEDLEFFWRLFKKGHRFIWNRDIKVMHYRDDAFRSFIKQAYVYGRGNFLVQHIHRDHPLLKEIKTANVSFWVASLINFIKIPRFSYLLGKRLIRESSIKNIHKKLSVFSHLVIHKVFYIFGNIFEFVRVKKETFKERENNLHLPRLLILDITHSCNLSCQICDIWKTAAAEQGIEIFYIKRMLKEAKNLDIPEIALSGGEPLLRKDIFDVFDFARQLKIKNLGVLTNGILVKEYMERLKPHLLDNTVSLVISFDSLNPEVHNEIRNSGFAWQKTMEGLELTSSLKNKEPQVNFNLITIILNQNLEEIRELAGYIKGLGANSLQFQPLLPNNLKMTERKLSEFWVSEERLPVLDEAIDKLIEFKKENPGFIKNSVGNLSLMKKYYRATLTSADVKCHSAYDTILISNQGTCATCFSCYGNIRNSGLKQVLLSKDIISARSKVKGCSWPCLLPCFCD